MSGFVARINCTDPLTPGSRDRCRRDVSVRCGCPVVPGGAFSLSPGGPVACSNAWYSRGLLVDLLCESRFMLRVSPAWLISRYVYAVRCTLVTDTLDTPHWQLPHERLPWRQTIMDTQEGQSNTVPHTSTPGGWS